MRRACFAQAALPLPPCAKPKRKTLRTSNLARCAIKVGASNSLFVLCARRLQTRASWLLACSRLSRWPAKLWCCAHGVFGFERRA